MLDQVLLDLQPDVPKAAYAILGALFGYLVTHRFAIARDRRIEWNAVVDRLRPRLLSAYEVNPTYLDFPRSDADMLSSMLGPISRRRLARAIIGQRLVAEQYHQDDFGSVSYTPQQQAEAKEHIRVMLSIIRRR